MPYVRRLNGILVVLCAAALCAPAGAHAARDAELSIMDDQLLLGAPRAEVDRRMAQFAALGVDRVRVSAFWADHAPAPGAASRPAGFVPGDPASPGYRWETLDRVVVSARAHGLAVMVSVSTPAPLWGTRVPSRRNPVERPLPGEVAAFARAVALRYGAMVDQYGLLNEPNQGAWLQPQHAGRRLVSPHLYREIARAVYPAIKTADPDSAVLLGELAPSGRDRRDATSPVRPLAFLRAMACRDRRFRRVRRGSCRGFRPLTADALGHHPYSLFQSPATRSRERDDAAMGDTPRLLRTLDRLVRARALRPARGRRLDVHFTEFGYQTDPPDPFAGIPPARQSRWLQEAAYVAWRMPRVRQLNQFRLVDGVIDRDRGAEAFREFQSGLVFAGGRAKPALAAFPSPLVVTSRRGGRVSLWGQVRPGGRHTISLERRTGRRYRRLARLRTDARGYWRTRGRHRAGTYRVRWDNGSSPPLRVAR